MTLTAELTEHNDSRVTGQATAIVHDQLIRHIDVHATGLTPDALHAQHIRYGQQALNEARP